MAFLIVAALVYLTPSLTGELPPWWSSILPQDKIHLGLDLQGGMHLALEVEASKAVESHLERVVEDLKQDLRDKKIRYLELKRRGSDGIDITLMRAEDRDAFDNLMRTEYSDFEIGQGKAQEKGYALVLTLSTAARNQIMKLATDQEPCRSVWSKRTRYQTSGK
jgi:preprotein translocase subunit SecD